MTDNTLPEIDVQQIVYIREGKIVTKDDISDSAEYELQKLNKDAELLYAEKHALGEPIILETVALNSDIHAQANAVLTHARGTTLKEITGDYYLEIEIRVFIPLEDFELTVALDEDERHLVKAIFKPTAVDAATQKVSLTTLSAYVVDVFLTDPVHIRTKEIYYSPERQLHTIIYIFLALDAENRVSERFGFCEFSEIAIAEMEIEEDVENPEKGYIPPICDQAYLDEVSQYLGMDFVVHADTENTVIEIDDVQKHKNFNRQWLNSEQQPTIVELFLESGIAQTEIFDVPLALHMKTAHAYTRLVHKLRQRISMEQLNASHYIYMLEPISRDSTEMVPLEPGQYKRPKRVCTYQSVTVEFECFVFDENHRPIKKYRFGYANEVQPFFEEIFKYDEDGQIIDSKVINRKKE